MAAVEVEAYTVSYSLYHRIGPGWSSVMHKDYESPQTSVIEDAPCQNKGKNLDQHVIERSMRQLRSAV